MSLRFHKGHSFYHLFPVVWKMYFGLWAFEFLKYRVTWKMPVKWPYRDGDEMKLDYDVFVPDEFKKPLQYRK